MKNLTCLLALSFLGMLLHSCTITKRHFGKGYHIEWQKKSTDSGYETVTSREIDSKRESLFSETLPADEIQMVETKIEGIKPLADTNSKIVGQHTLKTDSKLEQKELKKEFLENLEQDEEFSEKSDQKVYPLTWGMMGTLTGMIVLILLTMMTSQSFGIGIVVFAFIGLILGIISLISLKRHPDKYRLKRLTKVFSMISIIAGGAIILAGILSYTALNN